MADTVETNTAPESNELEYVNVEDADDVSLDAALEAVQEGGVQAESGAEDDLVLDDGEEVSEVEADQEEVKTENKTEDDGPLTEEDYIRIRKEEHAKNVQAYEQSKRWAAERSAEVGRLRTQLLEQNQKIAQLLEEKFQESPAEALKLSQVQQKNEQEIERLAREEAMVTQAVKAQEVMLKTLTPDEADLEAMALLLKNDGVPAQALDRFKTNPYAATSIDALVQLGKRAGLAKQHARLLQIAKDLYTENQQLKAKPKAVLSKVDKALKQQPSLNGTNGTSVKRPRKISTADIEKLSDEELDSMLERYGK